MYDLGLFVAHGNGDCGAVGNGFTEWERSKAIVSRVLPLLTSKGLNVLTNLSYDLNSSVNNYDSNLIKGNLFKYKMAYTLHLNSSSSSDTAFGTEMLVPLNEKYFNIETEILNEFNKLGFPNRGIKSREYYSEIWSKRNNGTPSSGQDYFKEIREAWSNGISLTIMELCFINSKTDIERFNNNIDKIATIIANAILRECNLPLISIESKPVNNTPSKAVSSNTKYRVITGSFSDRTNADKRVAELKLKGFDSFIEIK